jgi:hypothetical protein
MPETRGIGHVPVAKMAFFNGLLWLNSENFGNFKDAEGHPAVPYLLVFETKP